MPTYEYACKQCGHQFEQFQSMKDEPLETCPACTRNELKRLIGSGAGIIFKGSGFYCNDYKSDSYNSGKKKASKAKTTSSTASSSKTADKKKAPQASAATG